MHDKNIIHLTYPYSSRKVSREIDSTDIITKMYIRNDDNGVHTQVFTDKEEAMQEFSKTIADLQSEYEYEIK